MNQLNKSRAYQRKYGGSYQNVSVKNNRHCVPCPLGAICDGDIVPIDGHWGYFADSQLKFIPCPKGFCCSQQTVPCTSYNTCVPGRSGTLCGICSAGYSQSFVSDGCVLKRGEACDAGAFSVYFVTVSLLYTIIFSYLPHIIEMVKRKFGRSKKLIDDDHDDVSDDNNDDSDVTTTTTT